MALARGRTILKENQIFLGGVLIRPPRNSVRFLRTNTKNPILFQVEQDTNPLIERALPSFANASTRFVTGIPHALSFTQERSFASYTPPVVHLPEQVDLKKVIFAPPKKNAKGGQFISVNYASQFKPLRVQTPVCRLPFGVSKLDDTTNSWSLQISLDEIASNPEMRQFFDFVNNFDNLALKTAIEESKTWFAGKSLIPEVITANFKKNVRQPKDTKYSPMMKLKIPFFRGEPKLEVFSDKEPVPIEALANNVKVMSIIEPRSVWFVAGSFGVSWAVLQTKILDNPTGNLTSYAFIEPEGKAPYRPPVAAPKFAAKPAPKVEEEEEEEDLDDITAVDEEGESFPKKTPAKFTKTTLPPPKIAPVKIATPPTKLATPPAKPAAIPSKPVPPAKATMAPPAKPATTVVPKPPTAGATPPPKAVPLTTAPKAPAQPVAPPKPPMKVVKPAEKPADRAAATANVKPAPAKAATEPAKPQQQVPIKKIQTKP